MKADPPPLHLSRRALLGGGAAAAGLAIGGAGTAQARGWKDRVQVTAVMLGISIPTMHDPALLVAGSGDSSCGRFAAALAPTLGAALPGHTPLTVSNTVGQDGVTGGNQFDALTSPDGNTALVAPGSAWLAWLAGDPRVHFDIARWVPVMVRTSPGVVVLRTGFGATVKDRTVKLATTGPTGLQLPAWLGLSMLGATVIPVPGLANAGDQRRALAEGRIDAALFSGPDATVPPGDSGGAPFSPLFSLGVPQLGDDPLLRDPQLSTVPSFAEALRTQHGTLPRDVLFDAWRATASAARLDSAVMLPSLAPAALVAVWRRAARKATSVATQDEAISALIPAPACLPAWNIALSSEASTFALRRWLADTAGWRPA